MRKKLKILQNRSLQNIFNIIFPMGKCWRKLTKDCTWVKSTWKFTSFFHKISLQVLISYCNKLKVSSFWSQVYILCFAPFSNKIDESQWLKAPKAFRQSSRPKWKKYMNKLSAVTMKRERKRRKAKKSNTLPNITHLFYIYWVDIYQ